MGAFCFNKSNGQWDLLCGGLDVEGGDGPGDGLVDVDAVAADVVALAVGAGDGGGAGARVAVHAVLAGTAVETPGSQGGIWSSCKSVN